MFGRMLIATAMLAGCAGSTSGAQSLPSDLAALVAQPQTGSFNPEASKDAEFFKDTPGRFRPFIAVCNPWDEWDKPAPPFKVYGNTYYVGTCGIAAILVAGDENSPLGGHVLIDTGTEAGADIVLANVAKLGFDRSKIKLLLSSHEHHDHVGGMKKLWDATGGEIISSEAAIGVMISGVLNDADPQFGIHEPTAKIPHGRPYDWGDAPRILAHYGMKGIETPGHSPGAMSWQWKSCEGDDCRWIVYADSLSPVSREGYRFSDNPDYTKAYFDGLERLGRMDCDILLTPHPSHSRMIKRMRTNTMIEPASCAYYAMGKARDIEERIRKEGGAE